MRTGQKRVLTKTRLEVTFSFFPPLLLSLSFSMSAFERLLPHPSFARLHDDRRDVRLRSGADIFRTSTDVCFIGWSTGCIQESLGSVISIDRGSTVPAAAALSASTAATSITNRMLSASDPLMINSDATRSGTPKPGVSIGVRLLLRALFLRRCFFDLCDSSAPLFF